MEDNEIVETEDILKNIKEVLRKKNISMTAFAGSLNAFLPPSHRRAVTRSRMVIVYRWFSEEKKENNPKSRNPNSHTILAMEKWYKANKV